MSEVFKRKWPMAVLPPEATSAVNSLCSRRASMDNIWVPATTQQLCKQYEVRTQCIVSPYAQVASTNQTYLGRRIGACWFECQFPFLKPVLHHDSGTLVRFAMFHGDLLRLRDSHSFLGAFVRSDKGGST